MTIEERMAELERKNRKLTWMLTVTGSMTVMLVVLAVAAGMAPAGNEVQESVKARRFVVVDERGRPRAMLLTSDNEPILSLSDEKGRPRAMLINTNSGPALTLFDEKNNPRACLGVLADGTYAIKLAAENGKDIAWMGINKGGGGQVTVLNSLGEVGASMQVNKNNSGQVIVYDHNGIPKDTLIAK